MIKIFALSCTLMLSIGLYAQKICMRSIDVPWMTIIGTNEGIISEADYTDSVLTTFLDCHGKPTNIDNAHVYMEAYRKGDHWVAEHYSVHGKYLVYISSFADPSLKHLDGHFYYFYPNGYIRLMGSFVKGEKQGWWMSGDRQGNILDSIRYEKGIPSGVGKRYYPSGKLRATMEFKYPNRPLRCAYTEYFEEGLIRIQGHYAVFPNFPMGQWRSFHRNGKLQFDVSYPTDESRLISDFNKFDRGICYDSLGNTTSDSIVHTGGYIINSNLDFFAWVRRNWKELRILRDSVLAQRQCNLSFTLNPDRTISDYEVELNSNTSFEERYGQLLHDFTPPFEIPKFFGIPECASFCNIIY
jgi:hypothetical protein